MEDYGREKKATGAESETKRTMKSQYSKGRHKAWVNLRGLWNQTIIKTKFLWVVLKLNEMQSANAIDITKI